MPLQKPNYGAEETAHIALKVRNDDNRDAIKEHASVLENYGTVVVGKMGVGIGTPFLKSLNNQINRGIETYLFLIRREGANGNYLVYQCLLCQVFDSLDEANTPFLPKYYVDRVSKLRTWFKISSLDLMPKEQVNRIHVISSGRSIMSVIGSSRTTFRVRLEEDQH